VLEVSGDLWMTECDIVCIPTNGILNSKGHLIMGKGVALQAKIRCPELPKILGEMITRHGNRPFLVTSLDGKLLASFPTKGHWMERANLNLIEESCKVLVGIVSAFTEPKIVALPRVGCGAGELTWETVKPVLERYFTTDNFLIVSL